jgi:hypothetical protein
MSSSWIAATAWPAATAQVAVDVNGRPRQAEQLVEVTAEVNLFGAP